MTRSLLLAGLLVPTTALAEPPDPLGRPEPRRLKYTLDITSCSRFKTVSYDRGDPNEPLDDEILIVLRNRTGETCWWDGVVLQGTVEGTYTPDPLPPQGLGLMLEAGGTLTLTLQPTSGAMYRPVLELFIPPDRNLVLLRAKPDATLPPEEPRDDASEG